MKEVVCLVFRHEDRFLLEQRLDGNLYFGSWTFPGGKVEEEDYSQGIDYLLTASIRESKQEHGLIPEEIAPFARFKQKTRHDNWYIFHGIWVLRHSGALNKNLEPGRRILEWTLGGDITSRVADTPTNSRIWREYLELHHLRF